MSSTCFANICAYYHCLSWTKGLQYYRHFSHCNWINFCINFHLKFFQLIKLFFKLNPRSPSSTISTINTRTCSNQHYFLIKLIKFIQLIFKQPKYFILIFLIIYNMRSQLLRQRSRHLRLQPRMLLQQRSLRGRCAMWCQLRPIIKWSLCLCCWFHQLQ